MTIEHFEIFGLIDSRRDSCVGLGAMRHHCREDIDEQRDEQLVVRDTDCSRRLRCLALRGGMLVFSFVLD